MRYDDKTQKFIVVEDWTMTLFKLFITGCLMYYYGWVLIFPCALLTLRRERS